MRPRTRAPALLGAMAMAPLALVGGARSADAQEIRGAIVADTVRVGDVVPVALRTAVGPGQRVVWPDTLPLGGPASELENAARVRTREDTLPDGRLQVTGIYAITPWRAGEHALPDVDVAIIAGDEAARTLTASLPPLQVTSVLPADTAGIEPRPAKGVIGRSWSWWPILLGALGLLALLALLWWIYRRWRRGKGGLAVPVPALPPREAALAALDRAREEKLAERGEMKEFYTRISAAVRDYLAAVEPAWGEDRTTTELLGLVRAEAGPEEAAALAPILRAADQAKFARYEPGPGQAMGDWERARAWVAAFRWNEPAPDVEEAA